MRPIFQKNRGPRGRGGEMSPREPASPPATFPISAPSCSRSWTAGRWCRPTCLDLPVLRSLAWRAAAILIEVTAQAIMRRRTRVEDGPWRNVNRSEERPAGGGHAGLPRSITTAPGRRHSIATSSPASPSSSPSPTPTSTGPAATRCSTRSCNRSSARRSMAGATWTSWSRCGSRAARRSGCWSTSRCRPGRRATSPGGCSPTITASSTATIKK
jgi:hypothetical protein